MVLKPRSLACIALSTAAALLPSLACASGHDNGLQASPFMSATQVRDQFDDADFVFDFNSLIDEETIKEVGGQAIAAQITQFPALVNNDIG